MFLGPREYGDKVMMGHMGRAWARLMAYFYKERTIGALPPSVKARTYARGTQPIADPPSDSDEERAVTLEDIRQGRK